MNVLVPCPCCTRHIRAEEPACPFCGLSLEQASRGDAGLTPWCAVAALAATLALSGCDLFGNRATAAVYGAAQVGENRGDPAPLTTDSSVAPPSRESMQIYGAPPVPIVPTDNDR